MRLLSNTLSQTPVFVKHPYAQTKCLDNTTNRSVCQELFVFPPKMAGEGRDTLITKHSNKDNRQTPYRSVWAKECLGNMSV